MFNVKLYKDMFKQLRLAGIIFSAIALVSSVIVPILAFVDTLKRRDEDYSRFNLAPPISQITPLLFVMIFVAGLVLVLMAFSFLNKRSSSDYYHSLPNTRICTYLSVLAAVLSWIAIIVIPTVLITSGVYFALGFPFNPLFIGYMIATFLSSTCLVAAVTAVAMSITGTVISNLVVAGLIGFLPRIIFLAITICITAAAPMASASSMGLLDISYNLPVAFGGLLMGISSDFSLSELMVFNGGIIYTAILAVIYFVIAGVLFHFRKSESADKNAPSKTLQHIYRCAVAIPFLLPVIFIIFSDNPQVAPAVICSLGSILAYFAYEIITTRKLKKMLKAAPMYLAVVFAACAIGGVSYFVSQGILSKTPTANEIESMQVWTESYSYPESYGSFCTKSVVYTEGEMKEIFADQLLTSVQLRKDKQSLYGGERYQKNVKMKLTNGSTIQRSLYFNKPDTEKIEELQIKNADYMKLARKIPQQNEISSISVYPLNKTQSEELFNLYRQEIESISDEDYYRLVQNSHYNSFDGAGQVSAIEVLSNVGGKQYNDYYPINDITPKTKDFYIKSLNDKNKGTFKAGLEFIDSYDPETAESKEQYNFSLNLLTDENGEAFANPKNMTATVRNNVLRSEAYISGYTVDMVSDTLSTDDMKKLVGILKTCSFDTIDTAKPYANIAIEFLSVEEISIDMGNDVNRLTTKDEYITSNVYVQLTKEQFLEIKEISGLE